jgi:hypothetical protein
VVLTITDAIVKEVLFEKSVIVDMINIVFTSPFVELKGNAYAILKELALEIIAHVANNSKGTS